MTESTSFVIYPKIDGEYRFPDEVNQAIAESPEIVGAINSRITKPEVLTKTTDVTIAATDISKILSFSDGVDHVVTVPLASTSGILLGNELEIQSMGVGRISLKTPGENLWPYSDGEAGSVGIWYGRVGNTAPVSAAGPSGDTVIRSTSTGASSSGAFGMYSSTVPLKTMGLKVGDRISARMWISHENPLTNARFEIAFMSGTTQISRPAQTPTAGTGVRNIANLQIPIGCDGIQLYVLTTSTATNQIVDIAQVMFSKSTTAPVTYKDGRSPGWYWLGVPHASPSSNGILNGDRMVPKNGKVSLRYMGNDVWAISTIGVPDTVLTEDTVLNIDRDNGQGGLLLPSRSIGSSSLALVSNTAYSGRAYPSRKMMIKNIGIVVVTPSGTNDPIDVAILDAAGTRIVSSGSILGKLNSGAGLKFVPIADTMLQPGTTYYATITATSTATLLFATVIGDAFGTAMPLSEGLTKASTFPIGTTLTGMTAANAVPFLILKES